MNKKYDILIIGAGPGGLYASYYAHLKGLSCFLIDGNNIIGGQPINVYSHKTIYDFPTHASIKGYEVSNLFINQFLTTKTPFLVNTKLKSFLWDENSKHYIATFDNNEKVFANNIVIAIGAGIISPNKIETNYIKNIQYFVQPFNTYDNKKVIILGGGDSAIDWTNEIANQANTKSLSIIHRKPEFRATGKLVNHITNNKKINIFLDKTIAIVSDNQLTITDNKTNQKETMEFDFLIVQYGCQVNLEANKILKNFHLNSNNKIIVNNDFQTNHENIYAIGSTIAINKPNLIAIVVAEAIKVIENIVNKSRKYE